MLIICMLRSSGKKNQATSGMVRRGEVSGAVSRMGGKLAETDQQRPEARPAPGCTGMVRRSDTAQGSAAARWFSSGFAFAENGGADPHQRCALLDGHLDAFGQVDDHRLSLGKGRVIEHRAIAALLLGSIEDKIGCG